MTTKPTPQEIREALGRAIRVATYAQNINGLEKQDAGALTALRDSLDAEPAYWAAEGSQMAASTKVKKLLEASGTKSQFGPLTIPLYLAPPTAPSAHGSVPDGWQLVPKSPTLEMFEACADHWPTGGRITPAMNAAWIAMLASAPPAAPSAPESSERLADEFPHEIVRAPVAKGCVPDGWYCAHCQHGVDPSEVTFGEAHTACGRIITNDAPPPPANSKDDARDAARYRWLKAQSGKKVDFYDDQARWMVSVEQAGFGQNYFGDKIDAAIDAALASAHSDWEKCVGKPCLNYGPECEGQDRCDREEGPTDPDAYMR